MSYELRENKATMAFELYNNGVSLVCPWNRHTDDLLMTVQCNSFCALFHLRQDNKALIQTCAPNAKYIYFEGDKKE